MRNSNPILKTVGVVVMACAALSTLTGCANETTFTEPVEVAESVLPSNRNPFIAPEKIEVQFNGEFEEDLDGDKHGAKKQSRTRVAAVKGHAKILQNKAHSTASLNA